MEITKRVFNLEDYCMYRVPTDVYNRWVNFVLTGSFSKEYALLSICRLAENWIESRHPGTILSSVIDLTTQEARLLTEKLGYPFEPGMYYQVVINPAQDEVPQLVTILQLTDKT